MDTKIHPVISPRKRDPLRQHSADFKHVFTTKSSIESAWVSRLAREFNINANQVVTWHRQFADLQAALRDSPLRPCSR